MISSISTSFWLLESRDSTWLIFSGSAAGGARIRANDSGGLVRRIAASASWAIGLKALQTEAPLRSALDDAEADAGQADALVPVGISIIIRDTVYPLRYRLWGRVTKQHRRAGGVKIGSRTARVLRDNQFFVGWDHRTAGRGTFFVDETRFAKRAAEVTFVVDFKAQHAQFTRDSSRTIAAFSPIPPVNTTASNDRPSGGVRTVYFAGRWR